MCYVCHQVYKNKRKLSEHINKEHKSKQLCCNNCLFETPFQKEFKAHFVNDQCPEKRVYSCSECTHCTASLDNILNHMTTHLLDKTHLYSPQVCVHCNTGFLSPKLQRHLLHHDTVVKKYCCEYCKFITEDLEDLKKHRKEEHCTEKIDMVKCSCCNQKFFSMHWLKDHIAKEHRTPFKVNISINSPTSKNEQTLLTCKLCSYSTQSALSLNRHSYTIHRVNLYKSEKLDTGPTQYHCCECKMKTSTFSQMITHFDRHYTEEGGSVKYEAIERLDFTKNPHYICDVCDLVIMDQCQLAYHKLAKHGINNELFKCKLSCTSCDYNFLTKKICFEHGKEHVKENNLSRVCFLQSYDEKETGSFTIDYCSQIVTVEIKIIQTGQTLKEDVERITFNGKLEVLSFLQDEYIEDIKRASNLGDMLKWNIPEDVDLDPSRTTYTPKTRSKRSLKQPVTSESSPSSVSKTKTPAKKRKRVGVNLTKSVKNQKRPQEDTTDMDSSFESVSQETAEKMKIEDLTPTKVTKSHKEDTINSYSSSEPVGKKTVKEEPESNQEDFDLEQGLFQYEAIEDDHEDLLETQTDVIESKEGFVECQLCRRVLPQTMKSLKPHTNRHSVALKNRLLEVFYGKYTENGFMPQCRVRAVFEPLKTGNSKVKASYFLCNLCGAKVHRRVYLKKHVNKHARERNGARRVSFVKYLHENPVEYVEMESELFQYEECERDEVKANEVQEGYRVEEAHATMNTLKCIFCDFACSDRDILKEHYNEHKI
ncbi:zinc finger protein 521-like isoform X2 [Sitophilus oryzae]|nr:zinc finger protein 521-like isoform X2 [Sitophilus oryzae]